MPRRNDDETLRAPVFDNVAENRDILLTIFSHAIFVSGSPPFYCLESVTSFGSAKSIFGELIEFHAMAELLVQDFVNIHRALSYPVHGAVRAKDFEIEPVTIVSYDVGILLKLIDEFERIFFEPAPK